MKKEHISRTRDTTLNFDKPINKTGTISITLNSKKDYSTISHDEDIENAQSITFNYIVEEGDNTEAYLDYTNEYLIIEEGAQLTAADGTPVSLTMPRPGSENSLSAAKIMIDTEIPTIKYCYKKPNVSVFKAGDEIILEAEFSEEVSIAGNETPYVEVNYTTPGEEDKARFVYIGMDPEDPKTAWFKYTVKENDSLKKERIDFDGWTIEPEGCFVDKVENEANLDLPYNPSPWITPTWQLTFDTVAPHWGKAELTLTYDEEKGHVKYNGPKQKMIIPVLDIISIGVEGKDEKYVDYKSSYSTSHEDKAIVPGTSYIYFVYVEDAAGNIW